MRVTLEGLVVARDGRRVLDIPALELADGRTTAVFGPNGSGKTTLLRAIAGLGPVERGTVRLGGDVVRPDPATRSRLAFAFQETVFVHGSVARNLELGLKLRRVPAAQRASRLAAVARECGIAHLLDRPARALSTGEARRVNLARALVLEAPVTLLDEPLAGVDRSLRLQLLEELPRLLRTFAATTVLVTHDREEAFRMADDLVVLVEGRVRAAGPKRDVFAAPPDRATAELLGYTVLPMDGRMVAVPPGALRPGAGEAPLRLVVDSVVAMQDHDLVAGHVESTGERIRVEVALPSGAMAPRPGETIAVVAERWVSLPGAGTGVDRG